MEHPHQSPPGVLSAIAAAFNFSRKPDPGAWLFQAKTLQGLFSPAIAAQLPLLYRCFQTYSDGYFRWTGAETLWGGKALFTAIAQLSRVLTGQDYLQLQLADYVVYVDAIDPRLFAVIREFTQPEADTQTLSTLLSKGDTLIDIGANHGSFAILASHLVGTDGLVIAVEPQPRLAEAVRRSLHANAHCPVQVYQTAVGNHAGTIELLRPTHTSGSAGIYAAHSGTHTHTRLTVPIQPFDALIKGQTFPGNVLVKLDIEGSEYAFLLGAAKTITTYKPHLMIEIHPNTLAASGTTATDLKKLLHELGYRTYSELFNLTHQTPIEQLTTDRQRNVMVWMN